MFQNRALQVRMVKNAVDDEDSIMSMPHDVDPDQINRIAKEQVTHIALAIIAVVAGSKIINAASEIAIMTAKSKIIR